MATTDTDTARQICTDALREAGVVAIDEDAESDTIAVAIRNLNRMLKAWQNKGYNLWTVASMSVTATTSAAHTMDPVRPHAITSVRFKQSSNELPMLELARDEYDNLPNKAATGTPTQFYFDRQREDARLYVWPLLATASGETFEITYHREIEDMDLDDAVDVPGEWYEAVVMNLALRMCNAFGAEIPPLLPSLAGGALQDALADDRERSVFFVCSDEYV